MNVLSPSSRLIRPCTRVYLLLLALTLLTWAIGRAGLAGLPTALLVLALAVFKGQLVGDWFMGLRFVLGPWRWVIVAWLLMPGLLIGVAFTLSHRG